MLVQTFSFMRWRWRSAGAQPLDAASQDTKPSPFLCHLLRTTAEGAFTSGSFPKNFCGLQVPRYLSFDRFR